MLCKNYACVVIGYFIDVMSTIYDRWAFIWLSTERNMQHKHKIRKKSVSLPVLHYGHPMHVIVVLNIMEMMRKELRQQKGHWICLAEKDNFLSELRHNLVILLEFPLHDWWSFVTSVTRLPGCFSIFGHLQQWKFVQTHKNVPKWIQHFTKYLINLKNIAKDF